MKGFFTGRAQFILASIARRFGRDPKWDDAFKEYGTFEFKKYWETLPAVKRYQNALTTGCEATHEIHFIVDYIREHTRAKDLRALWLGCIQGDPAGPEIYWMNSGMFARIDVMDVNGTLIERNRQAALEWGMTSIEYVRQNLNEVVLAPNAYDVIYSLGTLHHIEKLERLLDQAATALRPDGLLFVKDYGGPNRLQFTKEQVAIVDMLLSLLPRRYRWGGHGRLRRRHHNYPVEAVIASDPSEAVHSEDTLPAIREKFHVRRLVNLGGTILHPLLDGIAGNFEGSSEADLVLRMLILLEKSLVESGEIPSDFFFCIAEKKSNPLKNVSGLRDGRKDG